MAYLHLCAVCSRGLSCSFPSPDTDHKSKTQSECSFFLVPAYLQQKTLPLSWPAAPALYTCFTRSNNFFAVGTRKMAWMRYVTSLALVHCCQALSSDFIRVIASLSRKCNPGPNFPQIFSSTAPAGTREAHHGCENNTSLISAPLSCNFSSVLLTFLFWIHVDYFAE